MRSVQVSDIDLNIVIYMAVACELKDLEKSVAPWFRMK